MSQTNSGWRLVGGVNPARLAEARLQAHHAVQLLTRVARGYIDAKDDDSHTNLGWDAERCALMGREVERGEPAFQLGLQVADLTLILIDRAKGGGEPFPFGKRTMDDAKAWVRKALFDRGLPVEPFDEPLHFEIPPHAVAQERPFNGKDNAEGLAELSRWFHNGFYALGAIAKENGAAEPRCWPHHFDVGILIELGADKSIGPGMEPGDESYDQPYFYVNPYPAPDKSKLPPLKTGGHWHTEGWTSAIATAEDIVKHLSAEEQEEWTLSFLREAVAAEKDAITAS